MLTILLIELPGTGLTEYPNIPAGTTVAGFLSMQGRSVANKSVIVNGQEITNAVANTRVLCNGDEIALTAAVKGA